MLLKTALEIAEECGLEQIGDAVMNIRLRAGQIFSYTEMGEELEELEDELSKYAKKNNMTVDELLKLPIEELVNQQSVYKS